MVCAFSGVMPVAVCFSNSIVLHDNFLWPTSCRHSASPLVATLPSCRPEVLSHQFHIHLTLPRPYQTELPLLSMHALAVVANPTSECLPCLFIMFLFQAEHHGFLFLSSRKALDQGHLFHHSRCTTDVHHNCQVHKHQWPKQFQSASPEFYLSLLFMQAEHFLLLVCILSCSSRWPEQTNTHGRHSGFRPEPRSEPHDFHFFLLNQHMENQINILFLIS